MALYRQVQWFTLKKSFLPELENGHRWLWLQKSSHGILIDFSVLRKKVFAELLGIHNWNGVGLVWSRFMTHLYLLTHRALFRSKIFSLGQIMWQAYLMLVSKVSLPLLPLAKCNLYLLYWTFIHIWRFICSPICPWE